MGRLDWALSSPSPARKVFSEMPDILKTVGPRIGNDSLANMLQGFDG